MNIGEKIKQARKGKNISQERLAEQLGLSVQAVSKWECNLSCPDIAQLPRIADFLNVSLDYLLRNEHNNMKAEKAAQLDLPDDDTLRIVQCIGRKIVFKDEWTRSKQDEKIPLYFDETWENKGKDLSVNLEIWGSADIGGSVSGNVTAGVSVNCDNVGNNVSAGNSVNCDDVGNNVSAGNSVNCDDVGNDANAGHTINCGDVGNNVSSGYSVTCGDVQGSVHCDGEIHCGTIEGDVLGGNIFTDN